MLCNMLCIMYMLHIILFANLLYYVCLSLVPSLNCICVPKCTGYANFFCPLSVAVAEIECKFSILDTECNGRLLVCLAGSSQL